MHSFSGVDNLPSHENFVFREMLWAAFASFKNPKVFDTFWTKISVYHQNS